MNWLSNLFGGLGKAVSGAGSSIFQGAQQLMNPISGAVNAGMKAAPGMMKGLQGFGGMLGGKQQPPATSGPNSIGGMMAGGFKPMGSSGGPSAFDALSTPGFFGDTSPDSSPLSGGKDDKKNWWENLLGGSSGIFPGGNAGGIAGLAIPAIGNMFAPKVKEIPDASSLSSVQALQNFKPGNSVSPEYQEMLQRNVGRLKDSRTRELQALYRNARPGTDYLTDTNYQRDVAELERGVQEQLSDDLAKAEGQFSSQEQSRLSELANLDIFQIMQQTGLSAQEADNFKQSFSDVGNIFLTNATRSPQQSMGSWDEYQDFLRTKQNAAGRAA